MEEVNTKKQLKINFKVISILLLVIILAAGTSYIAFRTLLGTVQGENQNDNSSKPSAIYPVFDQQDFSVKLKDDGRSHYIQTSIVLAANDKKLLKELQERTPQIRDTIITLLRSKNSEDIDHVQGTEKLKQEVMDNINEYLVSGKIVEVYFTDIVIQ